VGIAPELPGGGAIGQSKITLHQFGNAVCEPSQAKRWSNSESVGMIIRLCPRLVETERKKKELFVRSPEGEQKLEVGRERGTG
jgi:hypothetical protein